MDRYREANQPSLKDFFFQLSFRLRTHYGTYLEVARVLLCYSARHVIDIETCKNKKIENENREVVFEEICSS